MPSVRHAGVEREASFIKVVKVGLTGFGLCAKARQFDLRGLKVYFVAFAAQVTAETLPGFMTFLENALERSRLIFFPVFSSILIRLQSEDRGSFSTILIACFCSF